MPKLFTLVDTDALVLTDTIYYRISGCQCIRVLRNVLLRYRVYIVRDTIYLLVNSASCYRLKRSTHFLIEYHSSR